MNTGMVLPVAFSGQIGFELKMERVGRYTAKHLCRRVYDSPTLTPAEKREMEGFAQESNVIASTEPPIPKPNSFASSATVWSYTGCLSGRILFCVPTRKAISIVSTRDLTEPNKILSIILSAISISIRSFNIY